MRKENRIHEAFKEGYNVVGLTTAVAASVALSSPLPLLAGLVMEAAYLLFVPDSRWYETRVARKFDAEVEARRQRLKAEVLPTLRTELRDRFERLETTRLEIAAQPASGETWFAQVLRKLDYLLEAGPKRAFWGPRKGSTTHSPRSAGVPR